MEHKKTIVFFQLILLINVTIAFSYLASDYFLYNEPYPLPNLNLIKDYIKIIKQPIFSLTSASEDTNYGCCLETKTGEYCKESYRVDCLSDSLFRRGQTCDTLNSCNTGCCYGDDKVDFTKNVYQYVCSKDYQNWFGSPSCNLDIAKQGCCIIGSKVSFTTKGRCEVLTQNSPLRDSDNIEWIETSEQTCIAIQDFSSLGACVFNDNSCKMQTALECHKNSGEYSPNLLCTAKELNTTCEKTQSTLCDEKTGKIYYLDTCGNKANIYDSTKYELNEYWTKVVSIANSCESSSANKLTCGNCNRFDNSYCSNAFEDNLNPTHGRYYCKPQDCKYIPSEYTNSEDNTPVTYKNGETWCIYESKLGEGNQVPGTTNYLAQCDMGEIKINPCGSSGLRNELCVQEEAPDPITGDIFTKATCQPNLGNVCFNLNVAETDEEKQENLDKCNTQAGCVLRNFTFTDTFSFSYCAPEYPTGLDFSKDTGTTQSCDFAESFVPEIPIYFAQDGDGNCECKGNCEFLTDEFIEKYHNFCNSFGDCGYKVNLLGELGSTGSFKISGLKAIIDNEDTIPDKDFDEEEIEELNVKDSDLTSFSSIVFNDSLGKLKQDYINSFLENNVPSSDEKIEFDERISSYFLDPIGFLGGEDTMSPDYQVMEDMNNFFKDYGWSLGGGGLGTIGSLSALKITFLNPTLAVFSFALLGGWLGNWATTTFVENSGMSPEEAKLFITMGTIGAATLAAGITTLLLTAGASNFWNVAGWVLVLVGVVTSIATFVQALFSPPPAKCPGTEVDDGLYMTKIKFECNNWQAPTGGEFCHDCNENPLGCNLARCKSYGLSCEFSSDGICQPKTYDGFPQIKNLTILSLNNEYSYEDILESDINLQQVDVGEILSLSAEKEYGLTETSVGRSVSDTCLEPYENILFTFDTTQASLCKFDTQVLPFEQMEFFVGDNTRKLKHSTNFRFLSPDDLEESGFSGVSDKEIYVSCQNPDGTIMPTPYKIEFCLNNANNLLPPKLNNFNPKNNSYIGYNKSNQDISFYTKYLAECKYSLHPYANFDDMSNSFDCPDNLLDQEMLGYKCSTNIKTNSTEQTQIYIKCRNKYPTGTPASERKTNQEDIVYTLNKPEEMISVEILTPEEDEEIITIFDKTEKNLTVITEGGTDSHVCYYSTNPSEIKIEFKSEEYKRGRRTQLLDTLTKGQYQLYVQCKDMVTSELSNIEIVDFKVTRKSTTPLIARVSQENSQIKFTTNELANCVYSTESCRFEREDIEINKVSGDQINHRINAQSRNTYYIQCRDIYGQAPSGCSKIITAI